MGRGRPHLLGVLPSVSNFSLRLGRDSLAFFFARELLSGYAQLGERAQRALLLLWREPVDYVGHLLALDHVDLVEERPPTRADPHFDDTAVVLRAAALDHAALDHALDDAGDIRQ